MFALAKFLFAVAIALFQVCHVSGQRQWISPTTTAAEMWNGYTWYWPYAIAASEAYREWFTNAQQITNQLYQQAYIASSTAQAQNNLQNPTQVG